jgi:predicted acylesterase/phospholipase RssA
LTGDPVVLNRKRSPSLHLHRAIRASTSIQAVYPDATIAIDGREVRCWDGGTTGNCRFDLALRDAPDRLTVASTLTYRGEARSTEVGSLAGWAMPLRRPWIILDHTIEILLRRLEECTLDNLDDAERQRLVLIHPDVSGVSMTDFGLSRERKLELIQNGQAAAREKLAGFSGERR